MPTFIRKHEKQREVEGFIEVTARDWTEDELAKLRKDEPSRFFEVSESHAADVIRPQGNYQEVEDVATQAPADDARPVYESSERTGKAGSGKRTGSRSNSNGGSNRR